MRHNLGSILLEAERFEEAEEIYRQDLNKFPGNRWSLYGLWQSLEGQGEESEAKRIKKQFNEAWKHADVELTASRMM